MWDFTYDGDGTRVAQLYTPYIDGQPQTDVLTVYFPSTSLRAGLGGAYEVTETLDGTTFTQSGIRKYYSIAGITVAVNTWDVTPGTWNLSYLLTDHLGSVVAVTDSSGTLTSQQRYLPFGQVRTDLNGPRITQTDFAYTGQRALDALGLMDYKARFYSPALGRFLQPDTIIPDHSNPQSFNRYAYALNSPIRFNDPSGHIVCQAMSNGNGCLPNNPQPSELCSIDPDLPQCRIDHRSGNGGNSSNGDLIGDSGGGISTPIFGLPRNFNISGSLFPEPLGIYGDSPSYYILPFAVRITTQPSIAINNGSPITMDPASGRVILQGRGENVASRLTVNSDLSSNFGVFTFYQANDAVTHATGVGIPTFLTPNELNITFTQSTTARIPGSNLSVGLTIPTTVQLRYNPGSLATVAVVSLVGAAVIVWPLATGGGTILILSNSTR